MFRFNQAWMLDSTNADIYWGFGNLLGTRGEFKNSVYYFKKSIKKNPANPRVYECIALSYAQLCVKDTSVVHMDTAIYYIKHAVALDPNARSYAQLTAFYVYLAQKDSAKKYLGITDKLNPDAINPELRKFLAID